jgi:hypothetical protein
MDLKENETSMKIKEFVENLLKPLKEYPIVTEPSDEIKKFTENFFFDQLGFEAYFRTIKRYSDFIYIEPLTKSQIDFGPEE